MKARPIAAGYHRGGFTLLEVLLALAIFVGSAAVLSRLLMLGIDNAQYAQWQTEGLMIAESQLADLEAQTLKVDDAGSYTPENFPDWECTFTADSTSVAGVYNVSMTVVNVSSGPANGVSVKLSRLYFDAAEVAAVIAAAEESSSSSSQGATP